MIHAIIILSNLAFFGWCIWMAKPLKYRTQMPFQFMHNIPLSENFRNRAAKGGLSQ